MQLRVFSWRVMVPLAPMLAVLAICTEAAAQDGSAVEEPRSKEIIRANPLVIAKGAIGDLLAPDEPIQIAIGSVAYVQFPGTIEGAGSRGAGAGMIQVAIGLDTVAIEALPGATVGERVTLQIRSVEFAPFALPIEIVPASAPVVRHWVIASRAQLDNAARQRRPDLLAVFDGVSEHQINVIKLLDEYERIPIADPDPGEQGVVVRATNWILAAPEATRILRFFVANRSDQPYQLGRVQLMNSLGTIDYAQWIRLEYPTDADGAVTLAPGERVEGWLWVLKPELLGAFAKLVINEPDGDRPYMQEKIPVIDLRPPCGRYGFPEPCPLTAEEEERRRVALEAQRLAFEAQRVSLHIVASYGAIWLPARADGPERLEAAQFKGIGLRVTRGILPMLAIDGEIAGGTSGIAEYGTVTIAGTEGELTRSAKLGRVSLGGVLRFNGKVAPYARAGLGLQVVSQDATLMIGGVAMQGPDSGTEVGLGVCVGAGVDVKLGSSLIAGAAFSFSQSDQRILDFGINLAYRWDARETSSGTAPDPVGQPEIGSDRRRRPRSAVR